MHHSLKLFRFSALALAASTLVACNDDNTAPPPSVITTPTPAPAPAPVPVVTPDTYVLTSGNKLLGFAASAPSQVVTVNIAVPSTETLLGGDIRPADGLLYIVTKVTADNSAKVYTVDTATGALGTAVPLLNNGNGAGGGTAATPITITGSKVGVDFNPLANALRIVDDTGLNLRTSLAAGNNTFVDAPNAAGLAESAYSNSFANTCQTDLYHLTSSALLISAVPNGVSGNPAAGGRFVGALGVTTDANSGFDIRASSTGDVFLAALRVAGSYNLYQLDPATGSAGASLGTIPVASGENVLSLAALTPSASASPALQTGNMFAITGETIPSLVSFNRPPQGAASRLCSSSNIVGIPAGQSIVGADMRPNGGSLVVLTNTAAGLGTLYTVAADGTATLLSTLDTALVGSNFGVDFNPIPDRMRIVSNTGQNLRVNVTTGAVTTDGTLTTSGTTTTRTGITAAGYSNSLFGGSGTSLLTTLFALDTATASDSLVTIGSDPGNGVAADPGNPNTGVVFPVANLTLGGNPLDIGDVNAFDIQGDSGLALVAATAGTTTTLYSLNLSTGAASAAGNFASPIVAMGSNGAKTATTATVFGLTATTNRLVSFAPATPGTVTTIGAVTGIGSGETLQGIDFRPSYGPNKNQLVALTTAADGTTRTYAVNTATAAATPLATFSANAADTTAPYAAAVGTHFGIDFNPLPDALRTVSDQQQNLRSNVNSGATTTDGTLTATGIFGAGYTNAFSGTATTQLFYLQDVASGNSTLQGTTAPNDGTLTTVGTDLGADYSAIGDLDIAGGRNGFPLAALQPAAGGASTLFRISLTAGTLTSVGAIAAPDGEALRGIAIQLQ